VPLRLSDPFWAEAARRYAFVRVVPTGMQATNWEEVAVYAATLGLQTDAVYLARIDPRAVEAVNARVAALLDRGTYEPRTFYVLGDDAALARARTGMDPARDLLQRFDGRWVLAPGWLQPPANSAPR
jgi:2-hydroxychromene-2-carboxylate isomerase